MRDIAVRVQNPAKQTRVEGQQARSNTVWDSVVGTAKASLRHAARLRELSDTTRVILITLLGLGLRLLGLATHSLWFDEAFSWLVAQQEPGAILTERLAPILPPLYHLLLHFWIIMGESEVVLRSLSVLFGVMTIPLMYLLGREIFGSATGLLAAFGIAVLPFPIYFSQEARPYSMVIFLSALMLYAFLRAWKSNRLQGWIVFGMLAGLNFYAHHFVVFSLVVLHGFALTQWRRLSKRWRGLLLADLVCLAIAGPLLPSALAQTQQVSSNFWLSRPSPLQLLTALDFLLFGHTTPLWLVPAALFLTLSILALVAWTAVRVGHNRNPWLGLLFALVLGPMLLALLLSWLIAPMFLDRSFSLVTSALVLLLSWGLIHAPRRSPLKLFYGCLALVIVVSLGNHYLRPNPAKPPFREVASTLREYRQEGDVLLNLHDSSYLSLRYYAPEMPSYLLNNDPDGWIPSYTWEWAGQRVSSLDQIENRGLCLWAVIMPARQNQRQAELLAEIQMGFSLEREWSWSSPEPVVLRCVCSQEGGTGE